jgi:hypothetical protein
MLLRVIRFIAKRSMPEMVFVVRHVFFSYRKKAAFGEHIARATPNMLHLIFKNQVLFFFHSSSPVIRSALV